jgi:Domain of unknown function (DUF4129)
VDLSPLRRWWPVAGIAALLALAALAAPRSALRPTPIQPAADDRLRLPEFQPHEAAPTAVPPSAPPEPAANPADLPDWLITAATGLLIVAVVAVIGLLVVALLRTGARRAGSRRPASAGPAQVPADATEAAVAAVDAGLTELSDLDADPRRAVIGCWVRLEQAAAAAGTERRIGDTPTDLVGRLLAAHQVSGDVLATLARLYREARYGTHTVDEQMRADALAALRRLRGELTAGVPR